MEQRNACAQEARLFETETTTETRVETLPHRLVRRKTTSFDEAHTMTLAELGLVVSGLYEPAREGLDGLMISVQSDLAVCIAAAEAIASEESTCTLRQLIEQLQRLQTRVHCGAELLRRAEVEGA